MKARTRLRLTILIGAILSFPAVRTYANHDMAIDAAAIRVGIAMLFAGLAVSALGALLNAYSPPPEDAEPDAAIEDADLVDDTAEVREEPPL
jgi:hypothetical protein